MGEEVINKAEEFSGLDSLGCQTESLEIHTLMPTATSEEEKLHADLPFTRDQLQASIKSEMAMTIEDVLARRLRATVLDNEAATSLANEVASILVSTGRLSETGKAKAIEEFIANNQIDLKSLPSMESGS
ncbi:MAG: glycerol-3-phosphate dehydrogenase C-terminal domain-containing protein [Verrucomicrobiota bacterium]|nr:glycerol-3-phosphate dehydrogenase C-terminal domain-containing protein [Verrucomicrobiota bacterium]